METIFIYVDSTLEPDRRVPYRNYREDFFYFGNVPNLELP